MRILVVCNDVPYPPRSGVQLRIWNIYERIRAEHEVVFACHTPASNDPDVDRLNAMGVRTIGGRRQPPGPGRAALRTLSAVAHGRPPEMSAWWSPQLARRIAVHTSAEKFDLLQVEETMLAPYADIVSRRRVPHRFLTFHNVRSEQLTRIAAVNPKRRERAWQRLNARWMAHYEPRLLGRFDASFVVSERDRLQLDPHSRSRRAEVIENGVDTAALQPLPLARGAGGLVYVGHMGYAPGVDGAEWLCKEILPLLWRTRPGLACALVGRGPGGRVRRLANERVQVTGEVADVAPYYAAASVAVVPLRAGGGTRLKILEAMALGRPVVSTTIGAEGLGAIDGEHLLLADTPTAFAAAVDRLLGDTTLADRIVANARRLVETRYDWQPIAQRQLACYERVLLGSGS